jgi:hypothetical protein
MHVEWELISDFRRSFTKPVNQPRNVVLFEVGENLDTIFRLKAFLGTKDSNTVEGCPWINKSTNVCLKVSRELL